MKRRNGKPDDADLDDAGRRIQSVAPPSPDDLDAALGWQEPGEPAAKRTPLDTSNRLQGFRACIALLASCRTDAQRRATIVALAAFIHKTGESVGTLARRARCHRVTMQNKVRTLKRTAGFL